MGAGPELQERDNERGGRRTPRIMFSVQHLHAGLPDYRIRSKLQPEKNHPDEFVRNAGGGVIKSGFVGMPHLPDVHGAVSAGRADCRCAGCATANSRERRGGG